MGKKSIFKQNWFDRGIIFVTDLFDTNGLFLSYERFLLIKSFPVTSKEFNHVIKAIPSALSQLLKCHLQFQDVLRLLPSRFYINNKIKQVHIKILHNMYVTNSYLSKFLLKLILKTFVLFVTMKLNPYPIYFISAHSQ